MIIQITSQYLKDHQSKEMPKYQNKAMSKPLVALTNNILFIAIRFEKSIYELYGCIQLYL